MQQVMTTLGVALLVAACSGPAKPTTAATVRESNEQVAPSPTPAAPASVKKNQPAHIKLKLGHYTNTQRGIGATIDLTEMTENVADIDPAKLRFDGETKVWRLQGQHGPYGRIDYVRDKDRVMLQVEKNGGMSIYVPDPDGGPSSDEIHLTRDGDADPL